MHWGFATIASDIKLDVINWFTKKSIQLAKEKQQKNAKLLIWKTFFGGGIRIEIHHQWWNKSKEPYSHANKRFPPFRCINWAKSSQNMLSVHRNIRRTPRWKGALLSAFFNWFQALERKRLNWLRFIMTEWFWIVEFCIPCFHLMGFVQIKMCSKPSAFRVLFQSIFLP